MTPVLAPRERAAALFIHDYAVENGYCPTLAEIAERVGVAHRAAAADIVRRLRLLGVVATAPEKQARSYRLADGVVVHKGEIYITVETDA